MKTSLKSNLKKSSINDRVHLLEMTILNMAQSISMIKKNQDILIGNQNKIIEAITPAEEVEETPVKEAN